jgi:hypothetical protein
VKRKDRNPSVDQAKQKVREDFSDLKARKRAFHKELTRLQAEKLEALRSGDKEKERTVKQEIERLNASWREGQHHLWRDIRRDQDTLSVEKREQQKEQEARNPLLRRYGRPFRPK